MNSLFAAAIAASVSWQGVTEIAAGRGERGPWRQNESSYDFVDDPAVAIDAEGGIALAWVDQKAKDVFFRRLEGDGAVNVSRSPATLSWLPRVALAPSGARKVFVAWQEIIFTGGSHGGDIVFAHSQDGGTSFSAPLNLSNFSRAGDGKGRISRDLWHNGSLDLAAGADGKIYVAWTEYEGLLWLARSSDGTNFSKTHWKGEKPARAPSLAIAPDKSVYLAWTVGEDPAADIRVARSTDGGASFGEPVIVAKSAHYSDAPKLAVDAHGIVHLAYHEGQRVLYTSSSDGARRFAAPRAIAAHGAAFAALAVDGTDNVYVTWELFGGRGARGLGYAVSRDGGASFSAPGVVPHSMDAGWNGSSQGLLMQKLAVRDGAVAVVNSSLQPGKRSRVWLMRGRLSAR